MKLAVAFAAGLWLGVCVGHALHRPLTLTEIVEAWEAT
jgi:hypothetical protein